jgi:hypothetical protein
MKMKSHAKHQQNNANFRQLVCDMHVAHEAWGVRPDQYAGQQVAHDGREPEALSQQSQEPCPSKASRDRSDEGQIVHVCLAGCLPLQEH